MFPKRKESSNDIILFTLAKSADGELSGYHPKKKKTLILFSDFVLKLYRLLIDYFHHSIMQYFLGRRGGGGGGLHKNNTSYLLLGLYHASVNWMSVILMQIASQIELHYRISQKSEWETNREVVRLGVFHLNNNLS